MSLFQCDKCGCRENTACSNMGHAFMNNALDADPGARAALASYREILGLKPGDKFGAYCSACSPKWYKNGFFGIGPNPHPAPGEGLWHDKFPREFLPPGSMITDFQGNLVPRKGKP
jgi:hypothetical protein